MSTHHAVAWFELAEIHASPGSTLAGSARRWVGDGVTDANAGHDDPNGASMATPGTSIGDLASACNAADHDDHDEETVVKPRSPLGGHEPQWRQTPARADEQR